MWIEPPVLPPPEPDEAPELPHAARASAPALASATKPLARLLLYPCCIKRVIAPALSLLPLLLSGRHLRVCAGGQPAAYPPRYMSTSSGRPRSSGPGPSATVSPFTITYAHSACPRARLVFCSTTSTPMPRLRTARMCSHTCPSTRGARPAVGSSSNSSLGSAISARDRASMLRCPPLRVPAGRPSAGRRSGNRSQTMSTRAFTPDRRRYAPTSRLSCTVRLAKVLATCGT